MFATGGDVNVKAGSGAKGSGIVSILSGSGSSSTGIVKIASADSVKEGDSGNVTISTGVSVYGNSGPITLNTGNSLLSAGSVNISVGISASGSAGNIIIAAGETLAQQTTGGKVDIFGGTASGLLANGGTVQITGQQ